MTATFHASRFGVVFCESRVTSHELRVTREQTGVNVRDCDTVAVSLDGSLGLQFTLIPDLPVYS